MVAKNTKGFGLSIAILLGGLYLSSKASNEIYVVLASLATIIVMMAVVNRSVKGKANEIFISGFLLGIIEAYVFLIQPNWSVLPAIPGDAKLFFGFAFLFRAIIFILEIIDTPAKKPIKRWLKG